MTKFDVTILGCGSALPTTYHNPTSQLVDINEKLFMIDCGEGTQLQMRRFKTRMSKLHSIFISHLHGDHIFGLPGLLSTLDLLGKSGELNIYAHEEIKFILDPILNFFILNASYRINLITIPKNQTIVLFENKSIKITTFPLLHRIPTSGFLFEEKQKENHLRREMLEFHKIPIAKYQSLKEGCDYVKEDGEIIPNNVLTYPAEQPRRYAYCSDTAPFEDIIPIIKGVDLLFHEATFAESERVRARETFHSTAAQAANIAKMAEVKKLIIGHYSSRYFNNQHLLQEAQEIFDNTILANEGLVVHV